jgi:autotransporter-associated beta strand protein
MKTTPSLLSGSALKPAAISSLAAITALLAANTSAQAQSGTWNFAGTGLWSNSGNWASGVVADGSGNTATFTSGGLTTIRLDSLKTIGNLTFAATGTYTIDNNGNSANILTLAGVTPTISTGAGSIVTISSQIAGTAGLTKANNNGTLILTGVNTYSGTTSISGGSVGFLQINANSALGSSDLLLSSQNGGFRYGAAFNDLRNVAFGANGGRIDTNGFDVTISSTLSGAIGAGNSFTKQGAGTLTLAGTNNITGAGGVSVLGGFVQIDSNARLGSGTGALTLNGGGIRYGASFNDLRSITLGNSDGTIDTNGFNATFAGSISGGGGQDITKAGSGTLTISASQSYLGATNVNAGTLLINGNNSAATGTVTVASLATLGGNGTIGGNVIVSGTGTLAPGTAIDSTSTLTLNSTNLTLNHVNARVGLDITGIAAGEFDRVVGINLLTMNGDITITLDGTYGAASWDLFDFASKTGNFDSITLTGSYNGTLTRTGEIWSSADIGGQAWTFDQTTGVLSVVPEPSTAALLFGAAAAMGLAGRRRRA